MVEKVKLMVSGVPANDANALLHFVRASFYKNFAVPKIIGLSIRNLENEQDLSDDLYAIPNSTDLVIDMKIRLCEAIYSVSPAILSALRSGTPTNKVAVEKRAGKVIVKASFVKNFSNSNALTYGDLAEYFTFMGVKESDAIIHAMSETLELEFTFYIMDVCGLKTEQNNRAEASYILSTNEMSIAIAASTSEDVLIYTCTTDKEPYVSAVFKKGDPRKDAVVAALKHLITDSQKLWIEKIRI